MRKAPGKAGTTLCRWSLIFYWKHLYCIGKINYSSTKAAMSVMPKVITAEFFRRGLADKIRCVAVAPGYVGTAMVKGMNQRLWTRFCPKCPSDV